MTARIACLILLAGLGARAAIAIELVSTNRYRLPADATIESDAVILAEEATIDGLAANDLFLVAGMSSGRSFDFAGIRSNASHAAAGVVSCPGEIANDLWAIGRDVRLGGSVGDHARIVGFESVTVDGRVGNTFVAMSDIIRIGADSDLQEDAYLMAKEAYLAGSVSGRVVIVARKVTLGGAVGGDVSVTAEDIVVMPHTRIGGNLRYASSTELVLDQSVELGGELERTADESEGEESGGSGAFMVQIGLYLGALLAGVLFTGACPRATREAAERIRASHLKCLLAGYVTFCLVPMLALVAAITIVGIPVALMLGLCSVVAIYVSKVVVALTVGRWIIRREWEPSVSGRFTALSIGLMSLYLITNLPTPIGLIAWCWIVFAGLGGLVLTFLRHRGETGGEPAGPDGVPPPLPGAPNPPEPPPAA